MDVVGERLEDLVDGPHLSAPLVLLIVFVCAFVAIRISRWAIRRTIRAVVAAEPGAPAQPERSVGHRQAHVGCRGQR